MRGDIQTYDEVWNHGVFTNFGSVRESWNRQAKQEKDAYLYAAEMFCGIVCYIQALLLQEAVLGKRFLRDRKRTTLTA